MTLSGPHIVGPVPGPRSREIREAEERVFYPGQTDGAYPIVAARKERWFVEDVDGNVFVDLVSSSASVPFGAGRADVVDSVRDSLMMFGNEDSHALTNPQMVELAERLLAVTPDRLTRVDLALNGTEAIETAIRFMRRATGRPIVIGFQGSYHGESSTTASLGAEHHEISMGLRGLGGGFVHVPYPHSYRTPFGAPRHGGTGDSTIDYLRDYVLFHEVDPGDVAGIVIEPVLGSGGVVIPSSSFWDALVQLCDDHGWLLCLDEVKTGFGRTGELFAADIWNLQPDLMCLGKAMGGGVMPIGAVLGSERAMGSFDDLSTGSTWSWLPAACTAALATLDTFVREPVLENVRALDAVGHELLMPLVDRFDQVGDVRIQGCFMGLEIVADSKTRHRAPDVQRQLAIRMLERGVLVDSSTTSINIQPSLVMPPDDLRDALDVVVASTAELLT
jgi:4-aminobutyrate aminotransferase-like enzyme